MKNMFDSFINVNIHYNNNKYDFNLKLNDIYKNMDEPLYIELKNRKLK
jgi:hypothetical protein